MKKSLFIIITFISFCFINCGNNNSPSGLEGVNVNMNDGSTISNVDKLIIGLWECTELNLNDGTGWIDIEVTGSSFDIYFYADGSAEVYYFGQFLMSDWSSSGNTVILLIMGVPTTITNITSSTFLLVMDDGIDRIDFRFVKY